MLKNDGVDLARHQKQQHSVQHAVERGCDDQFKHDTPPLEGKNPRVRSARIIGTQTADCTMIRAYSTKMGAGHFVPEAHDQSAGSSCR